jgi:hypothetical protein
MPPGGWYPDPAGSGPAVTADGGPLASAVGGTKLDSVRRVPENAE